MLSSVLVCGLICLCVYLWSAYVYGRVNLSSLGVPEVPGYWLRGSFGFLLKENPAHWFIRIQRQFSGAPLVGVQLPWFRQALLVCDPKAVAEVFKPGVSREKLLSGGGAYDPVGTFNLFTAKYVRAYTDPANFGQDRVSSEALGKIARAARHLLIPLTKEPLWTILRKQMSPMLTPGRARAAAGLVRDRASRLTKRIDKELSKGGDYNLRQILADYTTDIISVALLGVESDSLSEGNSIVREATGAFMQYDIFRGLTWSSIFFCPTFLNILRTPMWPKRGVKLIELALKSGDKTIEVEKEEGRKSRAVKELLLSLHLPDQYKDIHDDVIVAQAVVLVQGGFETTASTMGFCLLELSYNQEAQEQLYQELREAKERVGRDLDFATLAELPYLNASIKETLRLYPTMGWIDRMTAQPVELAGVTVPAGTPLFLNMVGIQRDPLYFPDPDRFDPERFLPENEHKITPFSYLPFGEGSKMCIGRRFGEQTAQFGLSEIILNYTVSPGACPHPKDFTWEKKSMFLLAGEPLRLKFTRRIS